MTIRWYGSTARDTEEPVPGLSRQNYQIVRVSPKGTHLVTDFGQPPGCLVCHDITRGTAVRVTTDPSDDQFPTWSPDGERIVFTSNRSGRPEIYSQLSDGSGTAEKVFERPESQGRIQAEAWSKRRPHTDPHRRFQGARGARRRPAFSSKATGDISLHRQ